MVFFRRSLNKSILCHSGGSTCSLRVNLCSSFARAINLGVRKNHALTSLVVKYTISYHFFVKFNRTFFLLPHCSVGHEIFRGLILVLCRLFAQDEIPGANAKSASILDHVPIEETVHKENTIKPGPWSNSSKKYPLMTSSVKPAFTGKDCLRKFL